MKFVGMVVMILSQLMAAQDLGKGVRTMETRLQAESLYEAGSSIRRIFFAGRTDLQRPPADAAISRWGRL